MKAWLVYSDGSATNNTIVRCRNKLAGMRTFGITESDFSNCVEFCELHVDSSGSTFDINDMLESLLEVHSNILQGRGGSKGNINWNFFSAEVFSQDSQSCVPTPPSTTTTTTTTSSSAWFSTTTTTSSASARRFERISFSLGNDFQEEEHRPRRASTSDWHLPQSWKVLFCIPY